MNELKIKRLRRLLSLHCAVIAVLTAGLVSVGSSSLILPVLVLVVSGLSLWFVDTTEQFRLNSAGVFTGMLAGLVLAVAQYLAGSSEGEQLRGVAGLLVYPQLVLFLQQKSRRVFEQLAMFLLLEIMVAALVNDNIMFGILLLPIVLLWVSSLFLFARYVTLIQLHPGIDRFMPNMAEHLWAYVKKKWSGGVQSKPAALSTVAIVNSRFSSTWKGRRLAQSLPIGMGAIFFAFIFFYLLPRSGASSYRPGSTNPRVGLPAERLDFNFYGRALQDPTPVMRLKFTRSESSEEYELKQPPYVRARVFDHYGSDSKQGDHQWTIRPDKLRMVAIPRLRMLHESAKQNRDRVTVEFDLRSVSNVDSYTFPPVYTEDLPARSQLEPYTSLLLYDHQSPEAIFQGESYSISSTGFAQGEQLEIMPVHALNNFETRSRADSAFQSRHSSDLLQYDAQALTHVESLRQEILQLSGLKEQDAFQIAQAIEMYFIDGGEFKYTLDIPRQTVPDQDPIDYFVEKRRAGHCQFFASTMALMLRQSGIPSRLVIGYRPREYNQVGHYFNVRSRDAHAWVEALFTAEQLAGTRFAPWLSPGERYWVRMDPTPASDEEPDGIIDQPNPVQDYAEKLWKGYILEGRRNSIYDPIKKQSEREYKDLYVQWQLLREQLKSGNFGDLSLGEVSFAWPLAVGVFLLGSAGLLMWRATSWLAAMPWFRWRKSSRRNVQVFRQEFFARCVRALKKMGFEIHDAQTAQEFTSSAAEVLHRHASHEQAKEWLEVLTTAYYGVRFGRDETIGPEEGIRIRAAIRGIEQLASSKRSATPG